MLFFVGVVIAPLAFGTNKALLPELDSPSSLTGKETTAKFFAGATANNGASYANSFAYEQAIDVLTEIQIETSHVNSVGNLYVLIAWGEEIFMLLESGEVTWSLVIADFDILNNVIDANNWLMTVKGDHH